MKILYITFANVQKYSGGSLCAFRNLETLRELASPENVCEYAIIPQKFSLRQISSRMSCLMSGYMAGLTHWHVGEIMARIEANSIDTVFIDNSQLGVLAKIIRKHYPRMRIFAFFHNVEYDFILSQARSERRLMPYLLTAIAKYNEKCACRYASQVVCLHRSDARRLNQIYHAVTPVIIPITLRDRYEKQQKKEVVPDGKEPYALFLGSYFFGNIGGLKWFCDNVLPHVRMHLTIVGSEMDKFASELSDLSCVSIHSNVPDLAPYFQKADFMVLPIMSGGGMKVKTAEALMHGKYIIGSQEALQGYDVDDRVAKVCQTAPDYIAAIGQWNHTDKFCQEARDLFLEKYSYPVSLNLFKKLLEL